MIYTLKRHTSTYKPKASNVLSHLLYLPDLRKNHSTLSMWPKEKSFYLTRFILPLKFIILPSKGFHSTEFILLPLYGHICTVQIRDVYQTNLDLDTLSYNWWKLLTYEARIISLHLSVSSSVYQESTTIHKWKYLLQKLSTSPNVYSKSSVHRLMSTPEDQNIYSTPDCIKIGLSGLPISPGSHSPW